MIACVIPARGGSKRIPRKNIRSFAGRPMIAWSIAAAATANVFDRIIVSTDDAEIAEVARSEGAEVPFTRPAELANDHAGTVPVIAHAADWLGPEVEAVCCLYATAPFVSPDDLVEGGRRLRTGAYTYVFSATPFPAPVQRGFTLAEGRPSMLFPEMFGTRSQDLPEVYHDAGQFYWARPETWIAGTPVFSESASVVRVPAWRVCDIDTEEDWQRAERMMRAGFDA